MESLNTQFAYGCKGKHKLKKKKNKKRFLIYDTHADMQSACI